MTPANKIALVCAPLAIIAAAATIFPVYEPFTYASIAAEYPQEWLGIKPGMASEEARRVAGEPSVDGHGNKKVDRWIRVKNGVELRMDLWFDDQTDARSVIVTVCRWKHFMGADTEQHVDPPNQAEQSHGADGESASR